MGTIAIVKGNFSVEPLLIGGLWTYNKEEDRCD